MNDANNGDECEKELRVKKEAEIVMCVDAFIMVKSMPTHKPDDCEECGSSEDVMCVVLFWNKYHTEYPAEEDDDGGERPSLSLVFVKNGESGHDEHTKCDKVTGLEYGGGAVAAEAVELDDRVMNDKKGSVLVIILEILLVPVS